MHSVASPVYTEPVEFSVKNYGLPVNHRSTVYVSAIEFVIIFRRKLVNTGRDPIRKRCFVSK